MPHITRSPSMISLLRQCNINLPPFISVGTGSDRLPMQVSAIYIFWVKYLSSTFVTIFEINCINNNRSIRNMGNCVSQLFLTFSLAEDQRGLAHLGCQLKIWALNNDRTGAGRVGKREGKRERQTSHLSVLLMCLCSRWEMC